MVGGAERQLYLLLSHLIAKRFNIIVLTLHPFCGDYWEERIQALGIPFFQVPQSQNPLVRLFKIISILRPFQPDIIHGWHLFASPYAGLAAKVLKSTSLAGFRGSIRVFNHFRHIGILSIRLTNGLLVNSETTAQRLRDDFPVKSGRIFTVQNAVLDEFLDRSEARARLAKEFNLNPQKTWIGSMGRLDPKKRFDLLLQAVSQMPDESFQCLLIGDGPEMPKLAAQAVALELKDRVFFAGEIPNAAMLLKGLDIFAFTSLDEGLPNVIMEAGAAGLPILTWDLPFYRELLTNHRNALLVPPEDIPAFNSAMLSLLHAPSSRKELGLKARDSILNSFGLDQYIKNMTAVYESLLSPLNSSTKSAK